MQNLIKSLTEFCRKHACLTGAIRFQTRAGKRKIKIPIVKSDDNSWLRSEIATIVSLIQTDNEVILIDWDNSIDALILIIL